MACGWLGERVATVDVARAIDNVVHGREDAGWGPNAVFRFPKLGGTGAIWRAVAALLPEDKQVCACVSVSHNRSGCRGNIWAMGWRCGEKMKGRHDALALRRHDFSHLHPTPLDPVSPLKPQS
jgi:hypothetical protein